MVIVHYKPQQLWDWLNDHSCEEYDISDELLDNKVIIYKGPNNNLVPIQILKAYYPFYVCRICKDLGIPVPDRFKRHYDQLAVLRQKHEKPDGQSKQEKDKKGTK